MNMRHEYKMAYRAARKFFKFADAGDQRGADSFYRNQMHCYDLNAWNAALSSVLTARNDKHTDSTPHGYHQ